MDSRHVLLPQVFNTETDKVLETPAKGQGKAPLI